MPPYASQPDDIISEEAFLFTPATPYSPRITCILVPVQKRVQISGTVVMTHIIFPHLHVHEFINPCKGPFKYYVIMFLTFLG